MDIDPTIDALAMTLRRGFADRKARQSRSAWRPHSRFNRAELWWEIARNCQSMNADPDDFLDAAFLYCVQPPGGPYPQQLCTAASLRWYREFSANGTLTFEDTAKNFIQTAINTCLWQCPRFKITTVQVLLDECSNSVDLIPAWTRMILSRGDPRVAAKWRNLARMEVQSNPRLQKFLEASEWDLSWLNEQKR